MGVPITPPFYFATTRKISAVFGSLFNNIYVQRFTQPGGKGIAEKVIRVPLSFAPGEKWYMPRVQGISAQTKTRRRLALPRIVFELTNIQYDPQRKKVTNGYGCMKNKQQLSEIGKMLVQLNPVPYDFTYEVTIRTKNMDDGFQIIEQILPYFNPSYNLSVKDIPEMEIVTDIPVIFNNISHQDTYEGSLEDTRILTWTLTFTVKAWMYPPVTDAKIIKKVMVSMYGKPDFTGSKTSMIQTEVDPLDANSDDEWYPKVTVYSPEDFEDFVVPTLPGGFDGGFSMGFELPDRPAEL